jgi:hypothetical protein
MTHPTDTSIAGLLRGVMEDARDLIREEIALAKAEAREELAKAAAAGVQLGLGTVALWFGLMFVLLGAAFGIETVLDWPRGIGFALVGVVLSAVGAVALAMARAAARRVRALPRTRESLQSIKETLPKKESMP